MTRDKAFFLTCILAGTLFLFWTGEATARQNILIGGIGTSYTFWERDYDDESSGTIGEDEGDRRDYAAYPNFELQSLGQHNSLIIHYSPQLLYDDIASETDIDHYFDLDWRHQVSRQWSYQFTDSFAYSTDPTEDRGNDFVEGGGEPPINAVQPGNEITENLGTRRFWTNRLAFLTSYAYAPESNYDFGYNFRVLRDDSGGNGDLGYEEYDRHGVSFTWMHRYSQTWRSQLDLNYALGQFDQLDQDGLSQDLNEYRIDVEADYSKTTNNFFPVVYSYQRVDYENLRDDTWGHELSFGWDYALDLRNHLILGAGPSYVDSDRLDGEFGYNLLINYIRTYQRGSLEGIIEKRYLSREFTGAGDTGFTDATDFRVAATYQMSRDLLFDAFVSYRYEDILNPTGSYRIAALEGFDPANETDIGDVTYSRDTYSAGVTATYTVLRWLTASLGYVYYDRNGDIPEDSYNDHRIVAQLVASTELWR